MRVLVAMSGGVDSSVAAARLAAEGHDVVGVTLKLWGGDSDSGCCSVADVDDARRVAQQIGIAHHVFNMTEDFTRHVVDPYVRGHVEGRTPNPCIECNRHIKFDRLLARSGRLGFDALATGHHARVGRGGPPHSLLRGVDTDKDQSYVLSMLGQPELAQLLLPIGELTKDEVRRQAMALGLRTAEKPDSLDVCFIGRAEGRRRFLGERMTLHPGEVVEARSGRPLGAVDAVELLTVGQRRGLPPGPDGQRRYVAAVDVGRRRVAVGDAEAVAVEGVRLHPTSVTWVVEPLASGAPVIAQVSAHGRPVPSRWVAGAVEAAVRFEHAQRPVAPGQTVALYDPACPEAVVGAGIAA
jgi:tRNA-specific 2-thiouridylase